MYLEATSEANKRLYERHGFRYTHTHTYVLYLHTYIHIHTHLIYCTLDTLQGDDGPRLVHCEEA